MLTNENIKHTYKKNKIFRECASIILNLCKFVSNELFNIFGVNGNEKIIKKIISCKIIEKISLI